jgi:hypothetical protein
MLAAIEAPRMFASMVLVCASPRYLDDAGYIGGFTQIEIDTLLRALRDDYAAWSAAMAPVFMGNRRRPALAEELLSSFRQTDPGIAAQFATAIFNSDYRAELPKVPAECLIVQCEQDPVVPVAVSKYLSEQISHSRLETIATDGHFPHMSAPDRLVEKIRQFVNPPLRRSGGRRLGRAREAARWPMATGASDISSSAWVTPPVWDEEGRAQHEDLLLMRVGELWAQLGRFDMCALSIESWLDGGSHDAAPEPLLNVRTRGSAIRALLKRRGVAPRVVAEFEAIDEELGLVLSRHEIAARNCAIVPAFGQLPTGNPRDWYEFNSVSDGELLFFIDAIERDILAAASLYIRLADFAAFLGRTRN